MEISILTVEELEKLQQAISESTHIVVCAHQNPDGDAVGACLGWASLLWSLGKQVGMVLPDMYPDYLRWLPQAKEIVIHDRQKDKAQQLFDAADLVFCLDFNCAERLATMGDMLLQCQAPRVMIDHHPNPDLTTVLTISHPEMCSTCELIFRIVWQMGYFAKMDADFAATIYCGMMTDTGGFQYNSSTPDIYFIICQLLTKGIDKDKIYRNVFNNYSYDRTQLLGFVLYRRLKYVPEKGAAYFILTKGDLKRFHYIKGDLEGVVNMPLQIKGVRLSMSFREDTEKKNKVWVSLRSVDDLSCTEIAQKHFNGGGHKNASGGKLFCEPHEVEAIALKAISELPDTNQLDNKSK